MKKKRKESVVIINFILVLCRHANLCYHYISLPSQLSNGTFYLLQQLSLSTISFWPFVLISCEYIVCSISALKLETNF